MDNTQIEALMRQLKLTGMLETYPMRCQQAREDQLGYDELLGYLLIDEQQYRENKALSRRRRAAQFAQVQCFEELDLGRYKSRVKDQIRHLMTGSYLGQCEHVLIVGPTGTGKTHLAQALGNHACIRGKHVRFIEANQLYRLLQASRADDTWDKQFAPYRKADLLILDDFGLKKLTMSQADDLYELISCRFVDKPCIITSNRKVDGWQELFPDPVMANAILDRICNKAHHLILEGESYRKKMRPKIISTDS